MISYRIGRFKELILTAGVIAFTYMLRRGGLADFWELSNGAFLIGVYAATLELRYGSEKVGGLITRINLACIGLAVMVVFAIVHTMNPTTTCHLFVSMSFTIMALGICVQMKSGGVILSALGRYSLYIYMLHTWLYWKLAVNDPDWRELKWTVVACVITVMISLTLGYCFDHWISYIEKKRGV